MKNKTEFTVDEATLDALKLAKNNYDVNVEVKMWFMLTNRWEYYVTEMPDEEGYGFCYTQGFDSEFGSFSAEEVRPHIIASVFAEGISTDPESNAYLAPPEGGRWATREEKIAYLRERAIEDAEIAEMVAAEEEDLAFKMAKNNEQ